MPEFFSTDELARKLKVSPKTIRWNVCTAGHYCGLVPRRLPNRRLMWPVSDVEKLLVGDATMEAN